MVVVEEVNTQSQIKSVWVGASWNNLFILQCVVMLRCLVLLSRRYHIWSDR